MLSIPVCVVIFANNYFSTEFSCLNWLFSFVGALLLCKKGHITSWSSSVLENGNELK